MTWWCRTSSSWRSAENGLRPWTRWMLVGSTWEPFLSYLEVDCCWAETTYSEAWDWRGCFVRSLPCMNLAFEKWPWLLCNLVVFLSKPWHWHGWWRELTSAHVCLHPGFVVQGCAAVLLILDLVIQRFFISFSSRCWAHFSFGQSIVAARGWDVDLLSAWGLVKHLQTLSQDWLGCCWSRCRSQLQKDLEVEHRVWHLQAWTALAPLGLMRHWHLWKQESYLKTSKQQKIKINQIKYKLHLQSKVDH